MIDRARNDPRRGTLHLDSTEVPFLDVRAEPSEHAQAQLRQFAQETLVPPAAPQASRELRSPSRNPPMA
ncbi:MAG: hypothetical protein ACJ8R9_21990 [Steroidobacteraceae bacterium]